MPTGLDLVAEMRKLIGTRYVYGGKTITGLDCSGLVALALSRLGVPFPQGSANQIAACEPITVEEAWGTPGALLYRVGHDGISTGDGHSVEAIVPSVTELTRSDTYDGGKVRFTRGGLIPGITYDTDKGGSVVDLVWPVPSKHITSGYNLKRRLNFGKGMVSSPHAGIDMRASVGTVVTSPVNGTVIRVISSRRSGQSASSGTVLASGRSGNGVLIRYGNRAVLLGHVAPSVRVGDTVKVGDPVGKVDLSGTITAAHLHAEDWADYRDPSSHTNFKARLVTRGSSTPTPPPTEKDWFDMATRDDVKAAFREVLAEEAFANRVGRAVWNAEFGSPDNRVTAGVALVTTPTKTAERTLNAYMGTGAQRRTFLTAVARIEAAVGRTEADVDTILDIVDDAPDATVINLVPRKEAS